MWRDFHGLGYGWLDNHDSADGNGGVRREQRDNYAADTIANSNSHSDLYPDADAFSDTYRNANSLANADSDTHTDAHTFCDSHPYAISDANTHSNAHTGRRPRRNDSMRRSITGRTDPSTGFPSTLALALLLGAHIVTLSAMGLSGCGGGSSAAKTASGGIATKSTAKGRAALTFLWPKRTSTGRLIPVDANSIQVAVSDSSGLIVATQTISRPTTGATSATVTFDNLPVATYTVTATAFPSTDGTGTAQAKAQTSVTIVADQVVPITLTLASTIAALTIAPQPSTLTAGKTVTLIATPTDAQGNVVLIVSSTLQWSTSAPGVATVDSNGVVTGINAGSVTITATETESGKSASLSLTVSTPTPAYATAEATAYQMNPAHSGVTSFGQALTFPAHAAWSVNFPNMASYPLIAGGKVFVVADNATNSSTSLYAFDVTTGAILWGPVALSRSGTGSFSAIAYDGGRIFAINFDGSMNSFDAATGTAGWSIKLPKQYSFTSAPTAANGIVYAGGAGSGGTLYAVDEMSGNLLWTSDVENGDHSSPAISFDAAGVPNGIYVSYPCQVYDFNPTTGAAVWRYNGVCEGGGGRTPVYANGLIYVRDDSGTIDGTIYNAINGTQSSTTFKSTPIPAINATAGFFLKNQILHGVDTASQSTLWSFTGDGSLVTAPIVIDQTVFVGSATGVVYGLDAKTGSQLWSSNAGAPLTAPDEHNNAILPGFGAGEGYLIVSAGSSVTAWRMVP